MATLTQNIALSAQISGTFRRNIINTSTITGLNFLDTVYIKYQYLDSITNNWVDFTFTELFNGNNTTVYDNFLFKNGTFTVRCIYSIFDSSENLIETITGNTFNITLLEIKPTIQFNTSLGCCIPAKEIVDVNVLSYNLNLPTGTPTITYTISANDGSLINGNSNLVFSKTASGLPSTLSLNNTNFSGWNTFLVSQAEKKSYTIKVELNNNNFITSYFFQLNICDNYKIEYITCNKVKITNYNSTSNLIVEIKQFNDNYNFESIPFNNSNLDAVIVNSNQSVLIQLPNDNLYRIKTITEQGNINNGSFLVILDCNLNKCKANVITNYFKFKDNCDMTMLKKIQLDFVEFNTLEQLLRGKWAVYLNQRIDIEVNAINEASNLINLKTLLDRLLSICDSCSRTDVTICDPNLDTTTINSNSDCGCN